MKALRDVVIAVFAGACVFTLIVGGMMWMVSR